MTKFVLVVEDDPLLRDTTVAIFDDAGIQVEDFATADEALAFASDHPDKIAAVFTDVRMPGTMDGFALAKTIVARWPHIVVVINSGQVDRPPDFPSSVRFIAKPWRSQDVLPIFENAIDPEQWEHSS